MPGEPCRIERIGGKFEEGDLERAFRHCMHGLGGLLTVRINRNDVFRGWSIGHVNKIQAKGSTGRSEYSAF
jgi:hypothetical protein